MSRVRKWARASVMVAVLTLLVGTLPALAIPAQPLPARVPAAYDFTEGDAGCMRVALIFNMGAGYTPATSILDTLSSYGVTATMFPSGWFADTYPDIVAWMSSSGHVIGSHGYNGPELTGRSDWDVADDLATASQSIANAIGYWPAPWFTPFGGAADGRIEAIALDQGYTMVGWGVSSVDWGFDPTASSVYANVMDNIYDGAMVELHFDSPTTVDSTAVALPWIIEDLWDRGYTLVTVPEMAQPCA